ncbi:MAG: hypothetical protein D3X82_10775 [Candidatus Leucobacter sulfamidivorax]|nr:hypothetical protein [Candidatus Leucobacter sulfamidivorax]
MIASVLGPVDPAGLGTVLAAETLLRSPGPTPKSSGAPSAGVPSSAPAGAVEFERAPVAMPMLGRLLMGAPNRDDRTLAEPDAERALREFAAPGGGTADDCAAGGRAAGGRAVVALAGRGSAATPEALARLAAASGVTIVRGVAPAPNHGTDGADGADRDPERIEAVLLAELEASERPAGVVGVVPAASAGDPMAEERIAAAAAAALRAGVALVLETGPDPETAERSLAAIDAAGLGRDRVLLAGVAAALGDRVGGDRGDGVPGSGIGEGRLEALLGLGAALCFDDLGRIPTVRTVVSDFEIALAILRCAELGAAERVALSCGIRRKHRLTAFGGNGLEFVDTQFLPLLGRLGGDEELVAAAGGGNAVRILARRPAGTREEREEEGKEQA